METKTYKSKFSKYNELRRILFYHILPCALIIYIGYNCSPKQKNDLCSFCDTSILNNNLCTCIEDYINDSLVSRHKKDIKVLSIDFYIENEDTIMKISTSDIAPSLIPPDLINVYELKGKCTYNEMTVLFYDYIKSCGTKFYDEKKLFKYNSTLNDSSNNILGLPRWLYKVKGNKLILFKKHGLSKIK